MLPAQISDLPRHTISSRANIIGMKESLSQDYEYVHRAATGFSIICVVVLTDLSQSFTNPPASSLLGVPLI